MAFWKRKINNKISKEKVAKFEEASDIAEKDSIEKTDEIDWLTLVPKNKILKLEDAISKSERLKAEGTSLAENERYWEALKKFNDAVSLTPNNEVIYEMIAQSYMQLNELMPAVSAAAKVVNLNPCWWVGHQTLGRTLLNIGEVRMALDSFKRAIHLNPADEELWKVDLKWTLDLLEKKKLIEIENEASKINTDSKMTITELKDDSSTNVLELDHEKSVQRFRPDLVNVSDPFDGTVIIKLPDSYVVMR